MYAITNNINPSRKRNVNDGGRSNSSSACLLWVTNIIPQQSHQQTLTVNIERDADSLLCGFGRVGAAAGVGPSVVGVVHLKGDHAPGHAVLHLCARCELRVCPVPGERGRRVAALGDARERHTLAGPQVRARLVAQDRRRVRRICENNVISTG